MAVALLVCAALTASLAQTRRKQQGPRAVAVLEWGGNGPRLVPVTIFIDGRYYAADLYQARPVPMALERDTVYEVQKQGDPRGLFTITEPAQGPGGVWFAGGEFESKEAKEAKSAKPKASEPPMREDPEAGPPVLRKPKPQASAPPAPPAQTPPPATPPASSVPPPATAPPVVVPAPSGSSPVDTADRPVLRRGKPQGGAQASRIAEPGAGTAEKRPIQTPPPGLGQVQVAISDATKQESRSFAWEMKPDDKAKTQASLENIGLAEARKFAAKRNEPSPASKLNDAQVHVFDLDFSNEPVFVLTAKLAQAPPGARPAAKPPAIRRGPTVKAKAAAPPAQEPTPELPPGAKPLEWYVTVVGRQDIYGQMRKIFSWVTDSRHLDAYPRLELIDAVDVQGDSRGELLFREITDQGHAFALYRVTPDQLVELFNSGQALEQ